MEARRARRSAIGENHVRRRTMARLAALFLGGIILAWAVVKVGLGANLEMRNPGAALRFQGNNPVALSGMALAEISSAEGATAARRAAAKALATRAFVQSGAISAAPRMLALVAAAGRKDRKAEALMAFALRLSRRDLPVHLWFIERYVARGDIPKVLDHYDMALRTSKRGRAVLIPVLAQAISDPNIRVPLVPILASKPRWGGEFIAAVSAMPAVAPAAADLARDLARRGAPIDPYRQSEIANNLIAQQSFVRARELLEGRREGPLLRDGRFVERPSASPFSWQLKSTFDFGASRGGKDREGATGLTLFASQERGGEVARQLLTLPVGRYRLSTSASGVPAEVGDRPYWLLVCATPTAREIMRVDLLPGRRSRSEAAFDVPGDCGGQYLVLVMRPPSSADGVEIEVHDVAILPS